MIGPKITYEKYDPKKEYDYVVNWVLIASMGDPKTWKGLEPGMVAQMNKAGGDEDKGLAGCLEDLNVLQEMLYSRPSGKYGRDRELPFTNHLQSMLLADSNSVVGRETVLK